MPVGEPRSTRPSHTVSPARIDAATHAATMRAIGDPDVLLLTDLAVRRGAKELGLPDSPAALERHAERWRPWRSYALIRLWRGLSTADGYAQPRPQAGPRSGTLTSPRHEGDKR